MNTWAEVKAEARRQGLLGRTTSMVEVCNDLAELRREAKRLWSKEGAQSEQDAEEPGGGR